jgi:S-formylglutathione hydrolase
MNDIDARKHQGTNDDFYKSGQLLPENFLNAARRAGYDEVQVRVREHEGYDHGYYFVSTHGEFSRFKTPS